MTSTATLEHTQLKPASGPHFDDLLRTREMDVAIIGLGYIGLPLAVAFAHEGFRVLGIDIDSARVEELTRHQTTVDDVPASEIATALASHHLKFESTYHA